MKPFWKIWRKKSIRMKWTIGLPPCHFDHLISLSQTTGSNHCPVWVLWSTPWVRTLRCSNSSPPSWKSYSRISMQRVHHLSMRNMNAGICPFLGFITPRTHDKYKLCSTQAPSKAAYHSTCWQVDLNNTFLGILLQFRKDLIAISADLQQMFYGFLVRPDHRDCSRYLWHKDNEKIKISITCTCTSLVIVHPQQSQSIASEEQLKKVSQSLKQTQDSLLKDISMWMMDWYHFPQSPQSSICWNIFVHHLQSQTWYFTTLHRTGSLWCKPLNLRSWRQASGT